MNKVQKQVHKQEKEMEKMDARILEKFQVEELEKRYETWASGQSGGAYISPDGSAGGFWWEWRF